MNGSDYILVRLKRRVGYTSIKIDEIGYYVHTSQITGVVIAHF